MNWTNQINLQRELRISIGSLYKSTVFVTKSLLHITKLKAKEQVYGFEELNTSQPIPLVLLALHLLPSNGAKKIDVVQFCNGNCSATKVVIPPRKGK